MSEDEAFTGKLKGGPKKTPDLKPTKAAKIKMPKEAREPKAKAAFKAPKGGKIGAVKAHNYVKPHISAKKAETKFTGPKIKKGKR